MLANIIHCHSYGALDDVCLLFVKCKKGVPLENFTENNKPSYMDWHITRYFANLLHFTFVFANFLHNIPLNCLYCRSAQIPVFFFWGIISQWRCLQKRRRLQLAIHQFFFSVLLRNVQWDKANKRCFIADFFGCCCEICTVQALLLVLNFDLWTLLNQWTIHKSGGCETSPVKCRPR